MAAASFSFVCNIRSFRVSAMVVRRQALETRLELSSGYSSFIFSLWNPILHCVGLPELQVPRKSFRRWGRGYCTCVSVDFFSQPVYADCIPVIKYAVPLCINSIWGRLQMGGFEINI